MERNTYIYIYIFKIEYFQWYYDISWNLVSLHRTMPTKQQMQHLLYFLHCFRNILKFGVYPWDKTNSSVEIFILSMNNGFKTQFHCTLLFKPGSERPFFHPQHFLITGLLQISWLFAKLPLTSELNFQQRISSALSVSGHKYPLSSLYFLHLFPDSTFAPLRMSRLPWWWNQGSPPNLNPSLNYLKLPQTAPPRSCYSHISRHVLAPSWKYLMRFGMGTVQISPPCLLHLSFDTTDQTKIKIKMEGEKLWMVRRLISSEQLWVRHLHHCLLYIMSHWIESNFVHMF